MVMILEVNRGDLVEYSPNTKMFGVDDTLRGFY